MADETKETSLSGTAGEKSNNGQFKKGDDPRRNKKGPVSKERLAFNSTLRILLVAEGEKERNGKVGENEFITKKNVEWLIKSVWDKAIKGESWAVNFIADRVEGKITQPLEHTGEFQPLKIIVSDNGNK